MGQTCEFITYISPSDSYDIHCGAPACVFFDRKYLCKKHLKVMRDELRDARDREQKALNAKYSGLE